MFPGLNTSLRELAKEVSEKMTSWSVDDRGFTNHLDEGPPAQVLFCYATRWILL
jgi:hypothetical protein